MSNTTLIIAAVIAILAVVGLVLLLRRPKQRVALSETPAVRATPGPAKPAPLPEEGHGLADAGAAAVLDVATPLLGIDAHPDMPADELTRIKGLGPKAQAALNAIGIRSYAEIAALDPARAAEVDAQLGAFKGRLFRDRWIEQARLLEQNDTAGFEKEFGKLG